MILVFSRLSDILRRRHGRQTSRDETSPTHSRGSPDLSSKGSSVVRAFRFGKKPKVCGRMTVVTKLSNLFLFQDLGTSKAKGSGSSSGDRDQVTAWIKENGSVFACVYR